MTVTIYGSPCSSTRQAKKWFDNYDIPYVERDIIKNPLTVHELQSILSRTEEGTDEIIARKSKIYKDLNLDMDSLPLQQLLGLIHQYPKLLRSPIIIDEKRYQVGYHADDIRKFVPRKTRERQWLQWKKSHLSPLEGTI
ncbi:Spx/MgsR family RNA polymerase-binding regulatory protein [Virgibacillus dakarensis]|nr:Spx/MgsR family RNA polymerase-binding regulatory protein [Virgibacillus dakarensis]